MLSSWVLWNGVLSALFACFAAAHPLVVILSFIGAPITSLCPFVGIGLFTGILQALLCKPKISDMETLQDDITLKGFYKNRILRVLLVFILSSLGSSIGTFIGGADIIGQLADI
jgi:pheromone shutdown protein TraB